MTKRWQAIQTHFRLHVVLFATDESKYRQAMAPIEVDAPLAGKGLTHRPPPLRRSQRVSCSDKKVTG